MKKQLNILITSPSIYSSNSIGGISNYTKLLLENNIKINYHLFIRGRNGRQTRQIGWFFKQILVLYYFFVLLYRNRKFFDIAHVNLSLSYVSIIRDMIFIIVIKLFGIKVLTHIHGGKYILSSNLPIIFKKLVCIVLNFSDVILVLSSKEVNFFNSKFKSSINKTISLPNAVLIPSINIAKPNLTFGIKILYLGRIVKEKGVFEMVSGLENIPDEIPFELLIAGDGEDRDKLLKECANRLNNKYKYFGIVDGNRKEELLRQSHIFILPSYFEGLPYSMLESMAYKLVPIVTNVGSINSLIKDGYNGFFIIKNDHLTITNTIINLYNDFELLNKVSNQAYKDVVNNYSLSSYLEKLNKIYFTVKENSKRR